MDLTLVRHGEPVRGEPVDPGLSDAGSALARRTAAFLAAEHHERPYAALYTSPLRRAAETAEAIGKALDMVPVVLDGLAELDAAGEYTHFEDLVAAGDPRVQQYYRDDLSGWGTTLPEFRARVLETVDDVVARHKGQRVVLAGHGGVANVFFASVLGLDRGAFHAPAYCSVSRARAAGSGRYTLVSLNETAHLGATP